MKLLSKKKKNFLAASWPNGGRRAGIELPTQQPPGPFPPKDARGGFVLGGRVVLAALIVRELVPHRLHDGQRLAEASQVVRADAQLDALAHVNIEA